MSSALIEQPAELAAAEVVVKSRGIFQLRKGADAWVCSAILYGCSISFQPIVMNEGRVQELFKLARIEAVEMNENNVIVEFIDSHVTADVLREFGFQG